MKNDIAREKKLYRKAGWMFRKSLLLVMVALFALVAGACGGQEDQQGGQGDDSGPIQVVATYSILGDMVENVAGDNVELTTMVGPGEDTHTFEASPSDSQALADANLVFENGLEFETWLDELYDSSGSEASRVVVTEGIEPIEAGDHGHEEHGDHEGHEHGGETHEEHEHGDEGTHEDHGDEGTHEGTEEEHGEEGHEHGDEHGHDHGEYDPHVWQDPNNAVVMVENVRDALVQVDPDNEDAYRQNAEEYIAELEELNGYITEQVETIPEEDRKLVTGHQVFAYFAEEYGFEIPGTAISSLTTEASDPSAGEIAELADQIREENVPAIFPEKFTTDEQVMEQLANEANVELAPPLFTGVLAEEGEEGDTYLAMMRYNADTISGALGGSGGGN